MQKNTNMARLKRLLNSSAETEMKSKIDKVEGMRDIPSEYKHYYVVLRENRRVSDVNHTSIESASAEKSYWSNILARWPDGTSVDIFTCKNPNYKS